LLITILENLRLPSEEITKILETTATAVLQKERPAQDIDLCIVIETDEVLKDMNKKYRGMDEPTDVLSFESDDMDPETGTPYLGDIIISLEQARRQAEKSNHSLTAELQLLAVHGTLHLLGYDHAEEEEKRRMWSLQKEVLLSLGANLTMWPEE
jgi:probable rRNA maturation factor